MTSDENDEPLTRELLDRLRRYVEAKRGRGREIAALLGIEPSSVSDWLNGRTVPSLENGLRIQQYLGRRRRWGLEGPPGEGRR
jgi:transcriptional regulator with XRE-family HTH domain